MPVTNTPIFVQTPKNAVATVSTANTNTDGTTGTYATVLTAGANGARVERIRISSVGTNTADKVRLFVGGKLYSEHLFAATTPSNTVTGLVTDIDCSAQNAALILTASTTITANVNTGAGNAFNVHVFYGDY